MIRRWWKRFIRRNNTEVLTVRSVAAQSTDLMQWQDSKGTVIQSLGPLGMQKRVDEVERFSGKPPSALTPGTVAFINGIRKMWNGHEWVPY